MRNNYLMWIFIGLIFLGLVQLGFYYSGYNIVSVITLSFSAILIGLLVYVVKSFAIPSKWAFRNRFGIDGVVVSVYAVLISPLWIGHSISLLTLLLSFVIGFFLIGFLFKSNYNVVVSKKSFDKSLLEGEVLSDMCLYKVSGKMSLGMLIQTNKKRLIFIPVDTDKPHLDIDLSEPCDSTLHRKFGLPNGFIINDTIAISVSYPRLWLKCINEQQQ